MTAGPWIILACCLISSAGLTQAPTVSNSGPFPDGWALPRTVSSLLQARLETPISVTFHDTKLEEALETIAKQAGLRVAFSRDVLDSKKRVTLDVTGVAAGKVLASVLKGTGLQYRVTDRDGVIIESIRSAAADTVGIIAGRVVDSVSGDGIAGVTVTVVGTKMSTLTGSTGDFTITGVPVGARTITFKLLGYASVTRTVQVVEKRPVSLRILMKQTANMLSGVVTTATGTQRKVEVGNDITRINVDSVMRVMPVATLTDLLATRVPVLDVAPTSGAPGAPSRVRIRGVSSINATNDPILIVDGVRKYSSQIERSGNLAGVARDGESGNLQYVPSPLDQIDPNSIETVEVLKGPSAVALYGTDAANGVILITTKRGRAGPVQWNAQGIFGRTTMPGKWPTNYWNFGHVGPTPDMYNLPPRCKGNESNTNPSGTVESCLRDSVVAYQILNNPKTTVFGRGTVQTYRFDMRGGTSAITYSVSGSTHSELGLVKMPDVDMTLLKESGVSVPDWQRRPQTNEQQTGNASVAANLGTSAVVEVNTTLTRAFTTTTPLQRAISSSVNMPPTGILNSMINGISKGSGILSDINDFRNRITSRTVSMNTGVNVRGNPFSLLTYVASAGVDVSTRHDRSVLGRGECETGIDGGRRNVCGSLEETGFSAAKIQGFYDAGQGATLGTSVNLSATVPLVFGRWISVRSTVGGNYNRMSTNDIVGLATDIPVGATSGNGARIQRTSEQSDDRSVAGAYVETVIGLANRVYLPVSLRTDAGSGLGGNIRPKFPRLALSYVLSDEPVFRTLPVVGRFHELRLRTSYGQSGVQPSVTQKLRTYSVRPDIVDGIPVSTTFVSSLGNTQLRPERTAEWEGGLDASVWDGRFGMSLTLYRKQTLDALIDLDVPVSVNGGGVQRTNIGKVLNTGQEMAFNARLLERRGFGWNINMNISQNRNRLIKLGRQGHLLGGGSGTTLTTRFVEGYPLYGIWALPILGYADLNGDGRITWQGGIAGQGEVQIGNIPVYLGVSNPKYQLSVHQTMTLFTQFQIGGTFNYKSGMTQTNQALGSTTSRGRNDPSLPLATQAYLVVTTSALGTNIGITQTVSSLQFSNLSIGYTVPRPWTQAVLPGRTFQVSLQGTNLGLWTNYRGKDPNVSGAMNEVARDNGVLPTPRVWQCTVRVN